MKPALRLHLQAAAAIVVLAALALPSTSAAAQLPAGAIRAVATDRSPDTAQALRVVLGLSLLAILPALLVCVTSFLRVIMPPTTVALPLKVLVFVLVDGWGLLLRALVGSFH